MKTCTKCNKTKEFNEFSKQKGGRNGLRPACHECNKIDKEEWRKNNPFKVKNNMLKYRYGITKEQYEEMSSAQAHGCAICEQQETAPNHITNKTMSLAVDHCHETGKVRGLLCVRCNRGLGYFQDNPELLLMAANYLLSQN